MLADELAAGAAVTPVRKMVVALRPFLDKGERPEELARLLRGKRTITEGVIGLALDRRDERTRPARPSRPAPPLIEGPIDEPVTPLTDEQRAAVRARNAEIQARLKAKRSSVEAPTLDAPSEEVPA